MKNERTVYTMYEYVIFFKDQVYDWGRFQKTGSHTPTKITSYRPHQRPYSANVLALREIKKNGDDDGKFSSREHYCGSTCASYCISKNNLDQLDFDIS